MVSDNHLKTLSFLAKLFGPKNIRWILIGSSNLALQGVKVNPEDIDISTNAGDLHKIQDILKGYCLKPVRLKEMDIFKSLYGLFEINGIKIEVMADLEVRDGENWYKMTERKVNPLFIDVLGIDIPCMPLENELKFYKKLGRNKKVELIKKAMKNNAN